MIENQKEHTQKRSRLKKDEKSAMLTRQGMKENVAKKKIGKSL